ncbi:MAG: MBL fold metallo-hydrolase [Thermofilaceae archaeon]
MIPDKVRGLYLVPPHGSWLISGEKKAVLKSRPFQMANEWLAIIEDQILLGVAKFSEPIKVPRAKVKEFYPLHRVSEEEIESWWPDAETLYMYMVTDVLAYPAPIQFDTPPGVQTFIAEVELPAKASLRPIAKESPLVVRVLGTLGMVKEEGPKASILLELGGFRLRCDKGSDGHEADVVLISHAHPDHIAALEKSDRILAGQEAAKQLKALGFQVESVPDGAERKVGPFRVSFYPVLHSVKAPSYAIRIESDYGTIVWAPDILGWYSKEDRTSCLEGCHIFFVDGSNVAGIVRRVDDQPIGHVRWSTALHWAKEHGVGRVVFIHFGEQPLGLSPEEREAILKDLEAEYGVPVDLAKDGMELVLAEKLELERWRREGIMYDIEHAPERWRELLADLRYLGNSGYPRLKAGEPWGDWTLDEVLEVFGRIVDTLRGLYFPLIPPEKDDPRYHSSYWECYREAEKRGYIKTRPPKPAELKEWDQRRAEIIKSSLEELHRHLPDAILIVPEWASLTGSLVYGQHPPNDVDIVLKMSAPSGSLLKIQRLIQEKVPLPVQFSLDPNGPTWDFVPLYDLVAVKCPFTLERVREPEDVRSRLYKAKVETDPEKLSPDKPFFHYSVAGEFYIPTEIRLAWDKWARRQVERGTKIAVQPKFDGIRLLVGKRGRELWVWTERGNNVAHNFPGLSKALGKLGKSFMIDCEFVEFKDSTFSEQVSRTKMTWMATAKEPKEDAWIAIFVHDIAYLNGKNLTDLPYKERLATLNSILPKPLFIGRYAIVPAPTFVVGSYEEWEEAILKVSRPAKLLSTEGAMAKALDFSYDPKSARGLVVKLKNRIEIDCLIIGYRRMPKPKPAGVRWTAEEAQAALQLSDTYILRVALKDEKTGKLVPIESKKKLTERDLEFKWNEEKQVWEGTDDPKIWKMFFGIPHRGKGEYAYGNTYAVGLDEPPKPGMVVTVSPMELTTFEDEDGLHISWQHPIPVSVKEPGSPVGTVQAAFAAHKKTLPDRPFAVLI